MRFRLTQRGDRYVRAMTDRASDVERRASEFALRDAGLLSKSVKDDYRKEMHMNDGFFKGWFVLCAIVTVSVLVFLGYVAIRLLNHFT